MVGWSSLVTAHRDPVRKESGNPQLGGCPETPGSGSRLDPGTVWRRGCTAQSARGWSRLSSASPPRSPLRVLGPGAPRVLPGPGGPYLSVRWDFLERGCGSCRQPRWSLSQAAETNLVQVAECPWTALEQTTGKECQEQKTHLGLGVFLSLQEFGEEVGGGGMRYE